MFTIDLLKGTGVPIKNSPGTVALKVLPFVLPLLVAVYLFGSFEYNRTVVAMEISGIQKMNDKLTEYSAEIQQARQWTSATEQTRKNLAEVKRGLGRHLQWSPILQTLVEQLPDTIALKELKLSRSTTRKKVTEGKESNKLVNKTIIHRILSVQVFGESSWETDEAVQQYLSRLGKAPAIHQRLKDIRIVSQQTDEANGKPITIHTIECEFQPQE
ncbi:MAG: hypothetical protein GX455_12330 [Phycisphaerae bacterium]|nr:hypothetical protein [Phycisphaerae bacterium]